jgi:ATP-dependent helicase/nuclease subunit B
LHENLKKFFNLLTPPAPQSLEEWSHFVEELLDEFGFYHYCDQHICSRLSNILNDLSISATLTGEKTIEYRSFVSILLGALDNAFVHTIPAADRESVFIGRYLEARGLRFKAVAILGLAEGLFPSTERSDPFINESLRSTLGLEPHIGRHQDGLFYQAVTRADEYLLLTRSYIAENGEPWEPSHFWTAVQKLFPASVLRIKSEAARSLQNAASREEALFWAIRQERTPKHDPDLIDRARRIIQSQKILQARISRFPMGPYEGELSDLSETLTQDFGEQHTWSASRLESFSKCPFMYYASNLMRFEEIKPSEPGFDPAQRGSMYHAILEETFRNAEDPTDSAKLIAILGKVAREVFRRAPEVYGFRPSTLWQAEQDEMISNLEKTIRELADQSQGWKPYMFEQQFGKTPDTVLIVDTDIGPLKISGFIDRIDRKGEHLRIIDYKTGSSNFGVKDLLEGFVLQLPVYALAAQEALNLGQATHGFYWRINAAEPSSLKLDKFKYENETGPQAAYKIAREKIEQIVKHVRAGEFPPQPAKGSCPTYCVAAAWCWRYRPARFWT